MQQNSKCRLCSDRDETINHIISECSKLVQKEYKTRHDWVGKVIHWKMCKKFKFDHTNKGYMYNLVPVLENECLIRLTLIVFMMGDGWSYSCCFVGCCLHELFNIACSILVLLPSSFFSICLVSIHVVHPYSSINMTAAWKKLHFILSVGLKR